MKTVKIELAYKNSVPIAYQAAKACKEYDRLKNAFDRLLLAQVGRVNMGEIEDQAFCVMQTICEYLGALGVDIRAANKRYLQKLAGTVQ